MDIIGVYNHINTNSKNTMNLAITGQNYNSMILHLINVGLVGGNVTINIFADNDGDINGMNNIDFYKDLFKEFRPLYEDITLNYNVADYTDENGRVIPCKDFGNLSHPIKLEKVEI